VTHAEAGVVDLDWRAELVGHRATLVMLHGQAGEAAGIVAPLLDSPSVRAFVEAAIAGAVTAAYGGRPLTGLELARKAFAAHLGVWDQELFQSDPTVHVFSELLALTQAGLLEEAEQLAAAMHAGALQSQRGAAIAAMSLQRGLVASERGQPRTAAKWFGRALPLYDRDGPAQRRRFPLAGLVLSWATLGDVTAARIAETSLADTDDSTLRFTRAPELCARALLAAADKRPNDTLDLLALAVATAEESGERSGHVLALHTYARLGHPELAAADAARLRAEVEGELLGARCDHVVAAAAGDAGALADIAGRFATCGARLYAAEAFADASRAAQRSAAARDARMYAAKARELAALCEGAATPALVLTEDAAPLSKREREVAMLAAEGLTSKDIGERLYLSRRTVENHLHRAYDKLGTSGRAGLRAALGLDP